MAKRLLALCAGVLSLALMSFPAPAQQENLGAGFQLRHSFGGSGAGTTVRPWVQGGDHTGTGYSPPANNSTNDGLSSALGGVSGNTGLSNQGGGNIPGGKAVGRR